MDRRRALLALPVLASGCTGLAARTDNAALVQQVTETELAFARTMALRDHAAFVSFLAEDAVFLNGGRGELRGKKAIADYWKRYYTGAKAPFSWRPDRVAVIDSGTLASSTGPVSSPEGKVFGRFYSTWRRDGSGAWRIVFDDGCSLGH